MNRDEIILMAQQVSGVEFPTNTAGVKIGMSSDHLERFAALVAAAEREACAEICDHEMDNAMNLGMKVASGNCADKIRARGNHEKA